MTPREVSKQLRIVEKKYKDSFTSFGEIVISDMAKDAADAIDSQQAFIDFINSLPTCNECGYIYCSQRPGLGETMRYNCQAFFREGSGWIE